MLMAEENERSSGCTALMQTPVAGESSAPPKNRIVQSDIITVLKSTEYMAGTAAADAAAVK